MSNVCLGCYTIIFDKDPEKLFCDGQPFHRSCLIRHIHRRLRREFGLKDRLNTVKEFHPLILRALEKKRQRVGRNISLLTPNDRAFAKPFIDFLEAVCRIYPEYDPTLKYYLSTDTADTVPDLRLVVDEDQRLTA